jgi:hypothetical protein
MAKQRRGSTTSSYLPLVIMAATACLMLAVSGLAIAWLAGMFDLAKSMPIDRTGQIAYPALARPVSAFEKLTSEHFIDPRTGQLHVMWLPESNTTVAIRDMSQLIGRVASRNKQPNVVLSEADLLEKGTRPGLVAGIPIGKFAISVPTTEIAGLEQLQHGDHFDLLVALPFKDGVEMVSNSEPAALFGGIKPPSLRVGQLSRQHGVKHLVTNGMIVQLYTGSTRSTTGSKGLAVAPATNSRSPSVPVVFAELAVDGEEIGPLTEAISIGTKMTCVLRSGRPSDEESDQFTTEGMVPVITTATSVNAFSALSDENLMDETTGQLHFYYFPADKVSKEWITEPAKLYGRVVARPLRRGSLITESDLLPSGTRPGVSAGLPSGMAGMSLLKSNVQGFENLSVGDRFSILTRVPGEVTASSPNTTWATLLGGQPTEDDARIAEMVRTGIREVVRDAIYLAETNGESVIIGIPEIEVAKLAQLIRDEVEVFAVARSSQNELDSASIKHMFNAPTTFQKLNAKNKGSNAKDELKNVVDERQSFNGQLHTSNFQSPSHPVSLAESRRMERKSSNGRRTNAIERTLGQTLVIQQPPNGLSEPGALEGDKIPVPILVRDVPAFEELSIDDFVDPTTGRIQTFYFDPRTVREDWELDVRQLIDRVTLRPLRAGRPVRGIELAPPGSIAGPALGLTTGMRAVTVNAAQLIGLETMKVGSVFDIIAASGVETNSLADNVRQSIASSDALREATKLPVGRVAASRTVAIKVKLLSNSGQAQILIPKVTGASESQRQTRLTADGSTITETVKSDPVTFEERTVQQYIIAVPEESVGAVLGLLDPETPLFVSVRPLESTDANNQANEPDNSVAHPVRAIIQQHIRGTDITSEVFLTDRPEPLALTSSQSAGDAETFEGR